MKPVMLVVRSSASGVLRRTGSSEASTDVPEELIAPATRPTSYGRVGRRPKRTLPRRIIVEPSTSASR